MKHPLGLGDVLCILFFGAVVLALFNWSWQHAPAQEAIVRVGGKIEHRLSLRLNQTVTVKGALGPTEIEIRQGQIRISRDPSPRQYCVQQGWLQRAGQTAICLPNQVSIELPTVTHSHDSLSF